MRCAATRRRRTLPEVRPDAPGSAAAREPLLPCSTTILGSAAWDVFAAAARRVRFAAGQVLWSAGDRARCVHVLIEGTVRVVRGRGDRLVEIHRVERKGQLFGEVPALAGTGYPATAIAETAVICLRGEVEALRRAADADPAIMDSLLRGLGRRVAQLAARIEENTLCTVRSRLALHLRSLLADAPGGPLAEPILWVGSQQALAERLGTVREVVAREMTRLRDEGILASRGRGRVSVRDLAALERMTDGT